MVSISFAACLPAASERIDKMIAALFQALRPGQWSKNLLVFAGLVFAGKLFEIPLVLDSIQAFAVFCLLSSSVYLINDIADREEDRHHPLKKYRPIASGEIKPSFAAITAIVLIIAALGWSVLLGMSFLLIAACYLLVNLLYNFMLKRVVILDVMAVGFGFVLRVYAGTVVIHVPTSYWVVLCTFLLSLFISFGKRRHELSLLGDEASSHRVVLSQYSPYFLDQMISIVTTSTLVTYMIYTVSEDTVAHVGSRNLIYTTPFVLYGIFRYLFLIHKRDSGGEPALMLFTDKSLGLAVLLWMVAACTVLYF